MDWWLRSKEIWSVVLRCITKCLAKTCCKRAADADTGFGKILSQEAQNQLALAKTLFESLRESVQDGTISVGQLKLISEGRCMQQFVELYKIMTSSKQGSDVDQKLLSATERNTRAVLRLLNTRKRELEALQHQIELNKRLIAVCNTIPPVDTSVLQQKLKTKIPELQLNKVCKPITMEQLAQQGREPQPEIIFFSHPMPIQNGLQPLNSIQDCKVFQKLLKKHAARLREGKPNPMLSILEVFTQVFGPVYTNQLPEVLTKLQMETITLGQVDFLFRDIRDRPQILQNEFQMLARLRSDQNAVWVAPRLKQIQDYYRVQHQAQAAGELLKIRDAFILNGNFKPMETLNNVNAKTFKNQPLGAINQEVINAANILKNVGEKEVECLEQLARCKELINWVRQEIKDVQELKVFVDLAMISAGETDIEVDRVSCFHRAATGYAPFIFELKDKAGYRELLNMTTKVWKALENDQHLPQKLRDTQRQLFWLKEVKDSQGSVETSSLSQAEAINEGGVYTVGNLRDTATIKLRVAIREMTVDEEEEENERVYTLEMLRDLQSKLTLVAGKTQEDRQGLQAQVEQFVEVFTAAQQLASTYTKLNSAGCILFKEWKAVLKCGKRLGEVSVIVDFGASELLLLKGTRPLMVELRFLREFMDDCLNQWHHYVNEQRSKCYELNYYTTEQLVMLRQHVAQFTKTKSAIPAQIYVLLSSVKQMCNPDDIDVALKAAMRQVAHEAAPAPMESEAIDAPEVNEADILNQKKLLAKKLVDEFLFDESMALAAVQAVGLEHTDDDLDEYLDWCVDNDENTELIQELVTGLQAQGLRLSDDMTDEVATGEEMDDDDLSRLAEEEEMSFPSMAKTMQEVTEELLRDINRGDLNNQLKQLWQNHLHSMKSMDVEDCLSLEHLGIILHHLNEANPRQPDRKFPTFLKTGQPNLIVRSAGDIWTTVLSLYMHEGGHLPTQEEVLICNTATTLEQVLLLWRRALSDQLKRVFCLVRADLLDYDVSVKAEQQLHHLMQGKAGYHLVILSSSEREDSSHIVTALDQYRVDIPGVPSIAEIQAYLRQELEAQAQSVQDTTRVHPAAMITPHGCTVEVIVSSRPGVGKSLAIKRYAQKLCKHLGRNSGDKTWVTVPLQTAQVEEDIVVSALLPYQRASYTTTPRIFHLDIAPMVKDGLDHLLFSLLILGGLCNSHGKAWKRKPQDLYVVEITDFALQHRHTRHSSKHSTHPFYALLPSVTCRAPQEVLRAMQQSADWPSSDPKVDKEEFKSEAYQRTFQYLMRRQQNVNLDTFNFQRNSVEGTEKLFLETLLTNCGVIDPSWAELRHFAHFLSIQLQDCQQSTFCIPELLADTGLQGFKSFVVKFMVQMAKDFATPSLNMSEESPSKAMLLLGNNDGRGNGQQADIPELAAFQLRRRWESSFHPYIFFNHDRQSMTFMGFIIDQQGSLIEPTRRQIVEPGLMTPQLRGGLQLQRVDLNTDFDQLSRIEKLMALCMVLGVEDVTDPDDTYELTTDNVKKMLAIHMRFRCGIPVVIMGETGCGKTRLIRFLCRQQAGWRSMEGLNNMILMKVHGGTTAKDILKKVKGAEEKARRNKKKFGVDTVLFFDEANTTEAIGLIKEIMCDGRSNGEHINMADGALKIVAACNPYRRHSEEMIKRLKTAGLGYHVSAENAQEKLGSIPLRELVYRVQALPPSMLPLVWDFGQLGTDVETKYIRQIVQRHVRPDKLADDQQANVITRVLAASHDFMRSQKNECSFVSLRDVERCLEVMVWFYNRMDMLEPMMDRLRRDEKRRQNEGMRQQQVEEDEEEDDDDELLDDLTMSLVLALGVCYHACLQTGRAAYRRAVSRVFTEPCSLPGGAAQMQEEISRCQDVFLTELQLPPNIARNSALKENVFMMVVCIELRIPLFLVGKPGSSKSLAKSIVANAMEGDAAHSKLFKNLKQVHMISFQCSPLSTPDGIVGTFKQCSRFQEGKDLNRFVSVVVLDEVGLAEDSPRMPLKTLHPLLETGSEEDEDSPAAHKKVGFVGLSNWALDPAKMNRGILVSREEPDEEELVNTARGICATDPHVLGLIEPLIPSLAKAYLSLYKNQKREFFGLRDYYSLIKMVYSFSSKSGRSPTQLEIEHSVKRNFGGLLGAEDPMRDFEEHMQMTALAEATPDDPDCSPAGLLQASLQGHATGEGESRYLLVLTENYAALPILRQQLLSQQDAIIIFGSSFPYDQEYTQVCRNINKIKVCMETGRTVVLLNLENLYESLYDALNQYYVMFGGQRYVDLGLGTHRVKCRVHNDFRE
ncbi:E3 ubiquitin-protein ligase rnf213-alpha-like [Amphiura filiformis]|uniref:E3 ubiquitin-protein ligase rnf213-alpha-like n=1 Tax=Amphiura filiformis TaxID=82378 RepID=UPI003B20CBDE